MNSQKPREIALRILRRHLEGGAYLEDRLHAELAAARLEPRDRALVHELVSGVVRWQATLDWLIEARTDGRRQAGVVQVLLRLGLYQLFWLDRVPDHAAVNETVTLARDAGATGQAGFINAVLRGYVRDRVATRARLDALRRDEPAVGWSHPGWLVQRWQARLDPEALTRLLTWNNNSPPTFARANSLKLDPGRLLERWREENVEYDFGRWDWIPENHLFRLRSHPPIERLGTFREGGFYVQDPSTLLAVTLLAPRPGEKILDTCAAPGGKTTLIAQRLENQGTVVAEELDPARLAALQANCTRLGATCVQCRPADEGGAPADGGYDAVLADVPCSNTGVLRRRIDLRWRLRPEDLTRLPGVQGRLLDAAIGRCRPGGRVVYSTCSLEPEENQAVVRGALARHPGLELVQERELTPFADDVDGAYAACLRRAG